MKRVFISKKYPEFLRVTKLQFVPWQYIAEWKCIKCGNCCKLYKVVLNFYEWLKIVKNFGVGQTVSGLDKLFIKRKSDGSCAFLRNLSNISVCELQRMKPNACKLWPFKILTRPKFGNSKQAAYNYAGNTFFVYIDTMCYGLRYGNPRHEFTSQTLKEFIEIALGIRKEQYKTTGALAFFRSSHQVRGFEI